MPDLSPALSAIIVSYNTRDMTLECLGTLTDQLNGMSAEIILVDNGSSDKSAEAVRDRFPAVTVIALSQNIGFGGGNNLGMRQARGRYLLLLNTDAFPRPGAVAALVKYLDEHPSTGVVGPRLLNADSSLQTSCYPFPTPARAWLENLWISAVFSHRSALGDYRKWPHDGERDVDWVIGACMLARREMFESIGGFDERFFMYAEETDWQARIRNAGWKISFTPSAEVTHLGGASGKSSAMKINHHFFESLDLYERKHHGVLGVVALRLAMIIGGTLRLLLWLAVIVLLPRRRVLAKAKARLHAWLVWRQATLWRPILKTLL